jgi:hypothetical protein
LPGITVAQRRKIIRTDIFIIETFATQARNLLGNITHWTKPERKNIPQDLSIGIIYNDFLACKTSIHFGSMMRSLVLQQTIKRTTWQPKKGCTIVII